MYSFTFLFELHFHNIFNFKGGWAYDITSEQIAYKMRFRGDKFKTAGDKILSANWKLIVILDSQFFLCIFGCRKGEIDFGITLTQISLFVIGGKLIFFLIAHEFHVDKLIDKFILITPHYLCLPDLDGPYWKLFHQDIPVI